MTRAIITCRDLNNEQFLVVVERVKDVNAAKQLADYLEEHSAAQILTYAFVEEIFYKGKDAQETGHYDRCDQRLKLIYFDPDEGGILPFSIPAPHDTLVDADQEVTEEANNAAKALLLAITDRASLISRGGAIVARF